MSVVKRNIAANVSGQAWTALLSFLLIPWYVRVLGPASYGLVGFFATLQALTSLMDMGLSTAAQRETARLAARPGEGGLLKDMLRTLEAVYAALSLSVGLFLWAVSPWIATRWLKTGGILPSEAVASVRMMSLTLAFSLPSNLYLGVLAGLQRQVRSNVLLAVAGTVRGAGAGLVISLVSATPRAFFLWQAASAAAQSAAAFWLAWRSLPGAGAPARFRGGLLRESSGFLAGMTGNTLLWVAVFQADKLMLSRMLTLADFGRASLAAVWASALQRVAQPVSGALFPRFSELTALGDRAAIGRLYHRGTQLMALLSFPAAWTLSLFGPEVLSLWLRNEELARGAAPYLRWAALGMGLFSVVNIPYLLQLGAGRVRFAFANNALLAAGALGGAALLVFFAGPPAATTVVGLLSLGYVLFTAPLMHRFLLPGEWRSWAVADVLVPWTAAALAAGAVRLAMPSPAGFAVRLGAVGSAGFLSLAAAALSVPVGRESVRWFFGRMRTGDR